MKLRNIVYIVFMMLFLVLAYIFIDRGINTKTKILVKYETNSDAIYKVYLKKDYVVNKEYLNMNEKYVSDEVDHIDIDFDYKKIFSADINGFYSYYVTINLVTYKNDINNSVSEKKDIISPNKVTILNENGIRKINTLEEVIIDYDKYRQELIDISNKYNMELSGYLEVQFNIDENIDFYGIDKNININNNIKVIIPLSYNTFKINVITNNDIDSYYDFSKRENVNYLLLIFGAFSLSIGISFLALTIRNIAFRFEREHKYKRELNRILREYDDIIICVNKFYGSEKYNLIYLDSFEELLQVYEKIKNPINFKEIKKNHTSIFVMVDDKNAWIYYMNC